MGIIAKQSIKGALANYLGVLIGAVTTFFVVTDLLTQEEIGLTRVMVDAAMLFAGLAQLGTNASILRFYPRFRTAENPELRDHGFFGWTLLLPAVGFAVLTLLFFVFRDNIVDYYAEDAPLLVDYAYLLLPLTFFVLYMTVFETNASVLLHIALPKFVREVVVRVLNLAAYLLYGYRVIGLDLFVVLFCGSYAVAAAVDFVYLLSLGRISFRPDWHFVGRALLREVGVYTLFMTATVLAGNIKLFNSIFIAKESLAAAGVYTIACYIANVVEIPYRSLGAISSPIISSAVSAGNLQEVNRLGQQVALHQLLVACMLLFFIWMNLTPLFAVIPNGADYVSGMGVVLFLGMANILNSTLSIATNILNFSKYFAFSLLFISLLTFSAIALNVWLIPLWGVTGSACATLVAYVVYFTPLLTLLWRRMRVTLFCRKQAEVLLLTLVLFGLNGLWGWVVSPLFGLIGGGVWVVVLQALVRTAFFAVVAVWAVSRMNISPEVNNLLAKIPFLSTLHRRSR
ncbi:MAG: polysaccharide biosynthesis C-terminal domain-containing protein [Bacteroidales bacterium]|nr:polysaccharide biosynthesis C-terminal domain-containing protein [Bacteroidales bacterium]